MPVIFFFLCLLLGYSGWFFLSNGEMISFLKDTTLFWFIQGFLLACAVLVFLRLHCKDVKNLYQDTKSRKSNVKGGKVSLEVKRSVSSVEFLQKFCAAGCGFFVGLNLAVDAEFVKNYRIFWVLSDVLLMMYICLFNPFARNLILQYTEYLKKIEKS